MALVVWKPSLLSTVYDAEATATITFDGGQQGGEGVVTFQLEQGGSGTGATQWSSGRHLAQLIARDPHLDSVRALAPALDALIKPAGRAPFVGGRVVELGAGLGLVSVVAARLGAEVIATDGVPDLIGQLQRNLDVNCRSCVGCGSVQAALLPWGDTSAMAAVQQRLCELRRQRGQSAVGCRSGDSSAESEPEPESEASVGELELLPATDAPRVPSTRPVRTAGQLGHSGRTADRARANARLPGNLTAAERSALLWTFDRAPGFASPEVLLVADCVFGADRVRHEPLLATIEALCSAHTLLLLVQQPRYPTERRFFRRLSERFDGWVVGLHNGGVMPAETLPTAGGDAISTGERMRMPGVSGFTS